MHDTARPAGRRGLLASLGIHGFSHLDPVILAALLDACPLLLIGTPGTAKSELLNRIAQALGLEHRHYNASLIQIDDLLGFPVPNEARDGIRYLRTPGDLWSAQSVFLDELSRARPEVQNRLYSVLHERRIQGQRLERLRYRWSAMNPPQPTAAPDPDADSRATSPIGALTHSLPIDPALADRFAWVIRVPEFSDLDPPERVRLLTETDDSPPDATPLREALEAARRAAAKLPERLHGYAVHWVEHVVVSLHLAGQWVSGRRARMLVQSILSLHAARRALGLPAEPHLVAAQALRYGLPHPAWGAPVDEDVLEAVSRDAAQACNRGTPVLLHVLEQEADPVARFALALKVPAVHLARKAMSELLLDAWSSLKQEPERYAFAWAVGPVLATCDRFTAHACEQVSRPLRELLELALLGDLHRPDVDAPAGLHRRIDRCVERLRAEGEPEAEALGSLLRALAKKAPRKRFRPEKVARTALAWRARFTRNEEAGREAA